MSKEPLKLFIVPDLGWEREGTLTCQENRVRLIVSLDQLLAAINHGDNTSSTVLGGQVIELEDYLEVRGDNASEIGSLIREGKIDIGPWYVLPNEILASPEALVRNLLIGRRKASQFGKCLGVGYVLGQFGHIAQLPQILLGFGVDMAVANLDSTVSDLVQWIAPDGSRVGLINSQVESRAQSPIHLVESTSNTETAAPDIRIEPGGRFDGIAIRRIDRANAHAFEKPVSRSSTRARKTVFISTHGLEAAAQIIRSRVTDAPRLLGSIQSGVSLTARITDKQRNHFVQTLLERHVEPLCVWASVAARSSRQHKKSDGLREWFPSAKALTWHAWQLLLQNHSLKTLGGQAVDQVHREAGVRFDQAEQIAESLAHEALDYLASQVNASRRRAGGGFSAIVVFNPDSHPRNGVTDVLLEIPPDCASVELVDGSNNLLQSVSTLDGPQLADSNDPTSRNARIEFCVPEIPALGYRTFYAREAEAAPTAPIMDEGAAIENEFMTVELDRADGTLTLFDKRTGRSFAGLNRYADGGDCGDTYNYFSPSHDTLINIATNTPIYVERRADPVGQTLTYLQIYRIPRQLTLGREARLPLTAQFVPVSIMTTVRLATGIPYAEVTATVSNGALDHRLRAHFPAGAGIEKVYIDGHYSVSAISPTTVSTDAGDVATYPQRAFTTMMGGETGLTIASRGLPEVEIRTGTDANEIVVTLLRSVGWLSRVDVSGRQGNTGDPVEIPGAQCLGDHEFRYAIIPHNFDYVAAWREARAFQTNMRAVVTSTHVGGLPETGGLIYVDNSMFVVTTIKLAEVGSGIVVRGYSISQELERIYLKPGFATKEAQQVMLDESPIGDRVAPEPDGAFTFEVRPCEIFTVCFYPVKL